MKSERKKRANLGGGFRNLKFLGEFLLKFWKNIEILGEKFKIFGILKFFGRDLKFIFGDLKFLKF